MNTKDEIKAEYDEMMAELDAWEAKAEHATDEKYADFRTKRSSLRSQWEELKDDTDEAWDKVKDSFKKSLDELKEEFREFGD